LARTLDLEFTIAQVVDRDETRDRLTTLNNNQETRPQENQL
jgi:hypothetical protein